MVHVPLDVILGELVYATILYMLSKIPGHVRTQLSEPGAHILLVNFHWESPRKSNTYIRLGQDNWHRILEAQNVHSLKWSSYNFGRSIAGLRLTEDPFSKSVKSVRECLGCVRVHMKTLCLRGNGTSSMF